MMLLRSQSI